MLFYFPSILRVLGWSIDFLTILHNYRSSRDTSQGRKPANTTLEPVRINPILPPPPAPKFSTTDVGMVDYLSGEVYQSERSSAASRSVPVAAPTHSNSKNSFVPLSPSESSSPPPDEFINPTATMFTAKPTFDEPTRSSKSADSLPAAPWDVPPPSSIPPPPSRYNQRQQFFEQKQNTGMGSPNSYSGATSSYDSLAGQTENLSLRSSTPTKQEKQEDALFKDLVDFAKSKSSSTSKPNNRSYWSSVISIWTIGGGIESTEFSTV